MRKFSIVSDFNFVFKISIKNNSVIIASPNCCDSNDKKFNMRSKN